MENQHRKITGYRDLSQEEIDRMNAIKAKGEELSALLAETEDFVDAECRKYGTGDVEPKRWIGISQDHFQQGLMALTRAVARPNFW